MNIPTIISLKKHCAVVLTQTLLSSFPNEGCALLLGNIEPVKNGTDYCCWQIRLIWPCCNIWEPGIYNLNKLKEDLYPKHSKEKPTKKNRFAIDPREQFQAQRWARHRSMKILGSAHSHPSSEAIPSLTDLAWVTNDQLMLIVDRFGEIRAWWMTEKQTFKSIEVDINISSPSIENNSLS